MSESYTFGIGQPILKAPPNVQLSPLGSLFGQDANRRGSAWVYLAGDLPTWTKSADWTGGYPISTTEMSLFGVTMKFDGSKLTSDSGSLGKTTLSPAVSFAGGRRIGISVYAHRLNPNCGLQLRVGLNSSNYKYYDFKPNQNTLVEGWNFLVVHSQEDGALKFLQTGSSGPGWVVGAGSYNFDTQPATYMELVVTAFRAPNYPILWVGPILADGGETIPMITLGFDISTGYEPAKKILSEYKFRGYLAVGMLSQSGRGEIVDLYNQGWDVVGHSGAHGSMGTYTNDEVVYTELNSVRNQLLALGMGRSANLFASPNGSWSNRTVGILAENGFQWARNVTNSPIPQYDCSFGHINPLTQGSYTCGASTSSELNARVDLLTVKYKANSHFYTHEVVQGGNGTNWPADPSMVYSYTLDKYCAKLRAMEDDGLCKVVTPSEYLAVVRSGLVPQQSLFRTPDSAGIVVAASPFVLTNVTNLPVRFVVSGGAVSNMEISSDGSTFISLGQTSGIVFVRPGYAIRVTYTVVPTITQIK